MRPRYVIWDPAPNRVTGVEENWTWLQATRFLNDHADQFTVSARVIEVEQP